MKIRKLFLNLLKVSLCLVLVLSMTGCMPFILQALYEDAVYSFDVIEFKNTKWVCNELNMCFYISDFGEDLIWGEYTADGNAYRVEGHSYSGDLYFMIYTKTDDIFESRYTDKHGKTYICYDEEYIGYVDMNCKYDNGILTCNVSSSDNEFWDLNDAEDLTFEMESKVSEKTKKIWKNEELNMSIQAFEGEKYLLGEIVIKDKKYKLQGFELSEDIYEFRTVRYFDDSVEGTSMVRMQIIQKDGKLLARVTDDHLLYPYDYPEWNFAVAEYTFEPAK